MLDRVIADQVAAGVVSKNLIDKDPRMRQSFLYSTRLSFGWLITKPGGAEVDGHVIRETTSERESKRRRLERHDRR